MNMPVQGKAETTRDVWRPIANRREDVAVNERWCVSSCHGPNSRFHVVTEKVASDSYVSILSHSTPRPSLVDDHIAVQLATGVKVTAVPHITSAAPQPDVRYWRGGTASANPRHINRFLGSGQLMPRSKDALLGFWFLICCSGLHKMNGL